MPSEKPSDLRSKLQRPLSQLQLFPAGRVKIKSRALRKRIWFSADAALLGTMPDDALAARLRLSVSAVRDERLRRDIPIFKLCEQCGQRIEVAKPSEEPVARVGRAGKSRRQLARARYCEACVEGVYDETRQRANEAQLRRERERNRARPLKECAVEGCTTRFPDWMGRKFCEAHSLERKTVSSRMAVRRWKERNPEYPRQKQLARYGLTQEREAELFAAQNGLCPICELPLPDKTAKRHIDHVDVDGVPFVRGITHGPCNQALGMLRDDPARFQNAIAYLARAREAIVARSSI